jgi:hypothetical protein
VDFGVLVQTRAAFEGLVSVEVSLGLVIPLPFAQGIAMMKIMAW